MDIPGAVDILSGQCITVVIPGPRRIQVVVIPGARRIQVVVIPGSEVC